MRRFSLAGLALVLLTGSASAQTVYNVTTIKNCKEKDKMTIIEKVQVPTLDQLGTMPLGQGSHCAPKPPQCCMLADQPALLYRLAIMNAMQANVGAVGTGGMGALPRLDDLPRPALVDEKKPVVEEKKEERKDAPPERPFPATMITLDTTDWNCGRTFTDDCGRHWSLVKGCALPEKMAHMRGWLLESDGKKMYFVHETGNIYARLVNPAPLP